MAENLHCPKLLCWDTCWILRALFVHVGPSQKPRCGGPSGGIRPASKLRDCIMESVTNSPGENLSTEILGSDCRLDLEYQGIPHMCRSLTRFMNFAYSKCETRGRGSIHWANYEWGTDTQGLLDRLEFRCKRMLEIIS